jgi:hypothetical protein
MGFLRKISLVLFISFASEVFAMNPLKFCSMILSVVWGNLVNKDRRLTRLKSKTFIQAGVWKLEFEPGFVGIYKVKSRKTNPFYEVAAYKLSQLSGLNVVPETFFYKEGDEVGSLQKYIEPRNRGTKKPVLLEAKILFLDYLMRNVDRLSAGIPNAPPGWHSSQTRMRNLVIDKNRQQWAIDFGLSKPEQLVFSVEDEDIWLRIKERPDQIFPGAKALENLINLSDEEWAKSFEKILSPEEMASVRVRLEKIVELFKARGLF